MIKIQLQDDVTAAILNAIETGTEGGKAITTNGVAAALDADVDAVKAALTILRAEGLLDDYEVVRGKHGGFVRPETASAKKESAEKAKSEKSAKSASAVVERTKKALASGALSKETLAQMLAEATAAEEAEPEAAVG